MILATAIALVVASTIACADTLRIGSTDGGRSWTDLDPALLPDIQGGAGLEPGVSLYGVDGSVLAYSKATDSWANVDLLPGCSGNATVDAAHSGAVYKLNSGSSSVCGTTDFGKTLAEYPLNSACRDWSTLTVDPKNPSTLYALACNKIVRSGDGGRNWAEMSPNPSFSRLRTLHIDPTTPSVLYGTTAFQIFKSVDSGRTWSLVFDRLDTDTAVENFVIDPNDGTRLYAAGYRGLETSIDGGMTWRVILGLVGCLWIQPGTPAAVYVRQYPATYPGSVVVRKSVDGGATWTTFLEGDLTRFQLRFGPTDAAIFATSPQRIEAQWSPRQVYARDLIGRKMLAPGDIISIYGSGLTTETRRAASFPLPNSLAGVEVRFAGKPAPLFFASPGQVNAQIPFGLPNPPVMELRRADGTYERQAIPMEPSAPLMLTEDGTGKGPALCFHSYNLRRVTPEDPADAKESIVCYVAGLGEVRPAPAYGAAPVALLLPRFFLFWPSTSSNPFLTAEAPVLSARYAQEMAGVYELTIQIPAVYPGKYGVWFDLSGSYNGSPLERPILDVWNTPGLPQVLPALNRR